jgi:hypothetical protein
VLLLPPPPRLAPLLLLFLLLLLLRLRGWHIIRQVSQKGVHLAGYCWAVELMCAWRIIGLCAFAQHENCLVVGQPGSVWITESAQCTRRWSGQEQVQNMW